jgi:ATP-binding protein involved in chromosome partitioning
MSDKYDIHARQKQEQQEREDAIKQALSKVKTKLLVMSGKGGVGKSTVAVNLAVALANAGNKVGLMDVDLHGPSIPGMLGLTDAKPERGEVGILPLSFSENLSVVSMGNFMPNVDDALIWRGPMKITAIRQFISDIEWGELDYLVIDSPPGTGDEPLTVAQDVQGVQSVVVTTPQEVALADVRKSINFCKNVNMPVVGIVENMSGYVCPDCGHNEDLFGKGGGEKTAKEAGVAFLGAIPIDPAMVGSGDTGKPLMAQNLDTPAAKAYAAIVKTIESAVK